MANAYTPGLLVTEETLIIKERKLPLKGDILVKEGDFVDADTVVAKTHLPGGVQNANVANKLGIEPSEVSSKMLKKEGDKVEKGEVIAENVTLGIFKSQVLAPITGTIESISDITGQVIFRRPPIPIEVKAYIKGKIDKVIPSEGVIVKSSGTFIQGIFGIGGEQVGQLQFAVSSPDEELKLDNIKDDFKDKIIVGGSFVSYEAISKAIQVGVKGIVVGGIDDEDLRKILGYDIGVAITGSEKIGLTLIITEGFGKISMANKTFNILKDKEGKLASINGATQIRAGVIRPEVIVPDEKIDLNAKYSIEEMGKLEIGSLVRIIREPNFGKIAEVIDLPVELTKIPTESKVRVVKLKIRGSEQEVVIPRANIEIIED